MKRKQRQKRLQQEVVFPVRKEIKGTRGQQVRLGRGAFRDRKVIPAPWDQRGILALLGQRVRKEPPAQPGHRDLKGIRELQARQAHRGQKVTKAIRVWLDQQVRQVRRGHRDLKGIREPQARQVRRVRKVIKAILDQVLNRSVRGI
ncbi:hypothetical protein EsCd1KSP079_04441 [Escherichia sp. KS167_9B]|nr:hypothetical protein EsCd1KSP079_04441 [Escherichia sp. KS167_9B]